MILNISFLKSVLKSGNFVANEKKIVGESTISIDSREIKKGEVFIALRGLRSNGHNFIKYAVEKGACGLVIEERELDRFRLLDIKLQKKVFLITVPDTMVALYDLASAWRRKFSYDVVAITGSVGKTTTKEMLKTIFSSAGIPACVSYKNQNTLIGLCLNILKMRHEHKAAIFEVGISEKGEMEKKVALLNPTIGVITTVAHSHLEGLGRLVDVAKEKMKIFSGGTVYGVVCGDSDLLNKASYRHPVIRFGFRRKNQVSLRKLESDSCKNKFPATRFMLKMYNEARDVSLYTNHRGSVYNALAASATAHLLKLSIDQIADGLCKFSGFEGRFEVRRLKNKNGWLINDCKNASPESMRAALLAMEDFSVQGPKIAVLGDMLELGEKETFWHRQIGRFLSKTESIKEVILVGDKAKNISKTGPSRISFQYASDWREAARIVKEKIVFDESLVLVKASLAVELEKLVCEISL